MSKFKTLLGKAVLPTGTTIGISIPSGLAIKFANQRDELKVRNGKLEEEKNGTKPELGQKVEGNTRFSELLNLRGKVTTLTSENTNLKKEKNKLESENSSLKTVNTSLRQTNDGYIEKVTNLTKENQKLTHNGVGLPDGVMKMAYELGKERWKFGEDKDNHRLYMGMGPSSGGWGEWCWVHWTNEEKSQGIVCDKSNENHITFEEVKEWMTKYGHSV